MGYSRSMKIATILAHGLKMGSKVFIIYSIMYLYKCISLQMQTSENKCQCVCTYSYFQSVMNIRP